MSALAPPDSPSGWGKNLGGGRVKWVAREVEAGFSSVAKWEGVEAGRRREWLAGASPGQKSCLLLKRVWFSEQGWRLSLCYPGVLNGAKSLIVLCADGQDPSPGLSVLGRSLSRVGRVEHRKEAGTEPCQWLDAGRST